MRTRQTMVKINIILQKILTTIIIAYKYLISPVLGQHCRFHPSCSCYALQAIEQHGSLRGMFLATKRILRCHPWNEGGFDPVPNSKR